MAHRNTQHVVLNDTRWLAKVTYKSDNGPIGINYPFDNVEELTDLVEAAQERDRIIEILLSGRPGQASESWPWGAEKTWGSCREIDRPK
jgi:hypothetical protein